MTSKSQQFYAHTAFNLVAQLFTLIVGVFVSAVLARSLGAELRGMLGMILLLPMTLMAIFASGFTATVTYSVASKKWNDAEIVPSILGIATILTGVILSVACSILFFRDRLFPGVSYSLLLGAIFLIPVSVLVGAFQCLLSGKQAFREKMQLAFVVGTIRICVFVSLVIAFPGDLAAGLLAYVLAEFFGLLVLYRKCLQVCELATLWQRPRVDFSELRESLTYGWYSQLANLAGYLNYKVDQFIVFWMLGEFALGIYIIAVILAEKLWIFVSNVSAVLFSITAQEHRSGNTHTAAARVASVIFWFNLFIAVLLAFVAKPFIELVYTSEFSGSAVVVLYLLPGIVTLGFGKVLANYIAGIGHPGLNATASGVGVVVNITSNLVLIPRYGLIGAAVSTSISYTVIAAISFCSFLWLTKLRWIDAFVPRIKDLQSIGGYSARLSKSLIKSIC